MPSEFYSASKMYSKVANESDLMKLKTKYLNSTALFNKISIFTGILIFLTLTIDSFTFLREVWNTYTTFIPHSLKTGVFILATLMFLVSHKKIRHNRVCVSTLEPIAQSELCVEVSRLLKDYPNELSLIHSDIIRSGRPICIFDLQYFRDLTRGKSPLITKSEIENACKTIHGLN